MKKICHHHLYEFCRIAHAESAQVSARHYVITAMSASDMHRFVTVMRIAPVETMKFTAPEAAQLVPKRFLQEAFIKSSLIYSTFEYKRHSSFVFKSLNLRILSDAEMVFSITGSTLAVER